MGVRDVSERLTRENNGNEVTPRYVAPLLLESPVLEIHHQLRKPEQLVTKSDYYLWLFGLTAKVPYRGVHVRDIALAANNYATK